MCKTKRSMEVFDLSTDAQDNKRSKTIEVFDLTVDVVDLSEQVEQETM